MERLTHADSMLADRLPRFKNPPVIETVLGVQFETLPKFGNAHLGAFWQHFSNDWPHVSDVHPLDPQFERFGEATAWRSAGLQLKLSQEVNLRLQMRNATKDRMIQVQNGRLHFNWLGHGGQEYPRWENVKPEFDRTIASFKQFLDEESLGELQPNQWEVTYVNHIPKGTVWDKPGEWISLFPTLAALPAGASGVRLESFGGEWHYEIEPQQGRLHINLSHGWRKAPEDQEVLVLNLTARGPVGAGQEDGPGLDEGLHVGHETIVKAFKDLTSEKAHTFWELIDD